MQPKSINSFDDIDTKSLDGLKQSRMNALEILALCVPIVAIFGLSFIGTTQGNEQYFDFAAIVFVLWFVVALIYVAYKGVTSFIGTRKNTRLFKGFAEQNGLVYLAREDYSNQVRPGAIFHVEDAWDQRIENIFRGDLSGKTFSIYEYSYVVGRGKSSIDHFAMVVEFDLGATYPQIVIDSHVEPGDSLKNPSVLPTQFAEDQRIELEGTFSKYFAVYSPNKQEIYTLSILTPDLMEIIMKYGSGCDIEIVDNKLYLYFSEIPDSRESYQKILTSAGVFWRELGGKLIDRNYENNIVQKSLVSSSNDSDIQAPMKLKRSSSTGTYVAIIIIFGILFFGPTFFPYGYAFAGLNEEESKWVNVILLWIAFGSAVPYMLYGLYRRKKLLEELLHDNREKYR